MVAAQLRTLLYWPIAAFIYLVLTTSTGEAKTVVHKPAPKAETKWQGRLSAEQRLGITPPKRETLHVPCGIFAAGGLPVREVDLRIVSLM